jgi:dolichol kinase
LSDATALLISFVFVPGVVALAEALRRGGRISFDLSRKCIHVLVGSWILPTTLLFHSRWAAALPPAVFVLLNLLSLRGRWTRAMDAEAGSNVGTVLFPLSFVLLLTTLWGEPGGRAAICGGILALAWGDAAAALVGRRWGTHRYRAGSGWRSWEGSAAMFALSIPAVAVAGAALRTALGTGYPWWVVVAAAGGATLLEASGRRGVDNLLVPVGTALLLWGYGRIASFG